MGNEGSNLQTSACFKGGENDQIEWEKWKKAGSDCNAMSPEILSHPFVHPKLSITLDRRKPYIEIEATIRKIITEIALAKPKSWKLVPKAILYV